MKRSMMYDLYFGHLIPWERGRSQDPHYTPVNRKISGIKEHFRDTLLPDEYKRFEELENLSAQSSSIEDVELFEYGLSMGILLMIEVFRFKEKRLTDEDEG